MTGFSKATLSYWVFFTGVFCLAMAHFSSNPEPLRHWNRLTEKFDTQLRVTVQKDLDYPLHDKLLIELLEPTHGYVIESRTIVRAELEHL